jgi:AraC-like DNA-binding protein
MQVTEAGFATFRSGTRSMGHAHAAEGEFHLFTTGSGTFLDNGHPCRLSPGLVFYSAPGESHELLLAGHDKVAFYWVRFRPGREPASRRAWLRRRFPRGGLIVGDTARDDFDYLRRHAASREGDLRRAALHRFLAFCHGARPAEPSRPASLHIKNALEFLEERVGETVTLGALSDHVGLDPSYLDRLFKRATGESPMRHFTRLKIETACYLLRSTPRPVSEIAAGLGFSSAFHFSNVFKAFMGVSPSGHRGGGPGGRSFR